MAKIERKDLAHYLYVDGEYIRLGKDLEEYTPRLSAQVEKTNNILGQTVVHITGYEKTGKVDTFFAEPEDPLFHKLQTIVDENLTLEDCKASILEARLWEEESGSCPATSEECYLEVTGYGGDNRGYQIPFHIHYTGIKQTGRFDLRNKEFNPVL